jgi:uncharacterized membrane protein (UPF0127 family)
MIRRTSDSHDRLFFAVALFALALLGGAVAAQMLLTLTVGNHTLQVEIADTALAWRQGLMNRPSLPENQGMLFVYPSAKPRSFWMKDTSIPLDVAFLNQAGVIFQIEPMQPYDEEHRVSRQPAWYALEVNQGWFAKRGIKVGDPVKGLPARP